LKKIGVNGEWDTMTNTQKRIRFIQKFAQLTQFAKMFEIEFIIAEFHRTASRQKELYDAGKSQCDGFTHLSKHQSWLAIDLYVVKDGSLILTRKSQYEVLGKKWKELYGIWGGDWKSLNDIFHFQAGESSEWFQS